MEADICHLLLGSVNGADAGQCCGCQHPAPTQHIPCWCFHRVTPLLGICAEREITQEMMGSSQEVQKAGGEMEAEGEVDSHVEKWKCSGFWMEMHEGKRARWHDVVWALVAEHRVLPSWWHGGRELSVVWLRT